MVESYCGMNCKKCIEYPHKCLGCNKIAGEPLWASGTKDCKCPIYVCCVINKQLSCCKQCSQLVCPVRKDLADGDK